METFTEKLKPGYLLSTATETPHGVREVFWLFLLCCYPFWVAGVLGCWALYGVAWLAFMPVRNRMKREHPEDYARSQER